MFAVDPHPETGGRTVKCTCHSFAPPAAFAEELPVAYPPEQEGETSEDVAALIPKVVS